MPDVLEAPAGETVDRSDRRSRFRSARSTTGRSGPTVAPSCCSRGPCAITPRVATTSRPSPTRPTRSRRCPGWRRSIGEMRARWPDLGRVALLHRLGELPAGGVVGRGRGVVASPSRGVRGGPVRDRRARRPACRSGSTKSGTAGPTGRSTRSTSPTRHRSMPSLDDASADRCSVSSRVAGRRLVVRRRPAPIAPSRSWRASRGSAVTWTPCRRRPAEM